VDLVKNRQTKEPLNTMADKLAAKPLMVDRVAAEMMKGGVAVAPWISHLVFALPLIIEKQDIDFEVSVLDRALSVIDQE
jgi:taurine--2-oxoglutarate transaminase